MQRLGSYVVMFGGLLLYIFGAVLFGFGVTMNAMEVVKQFGTEYAQIFRLSLANHLILVILPLALSLLFYMKSRGATRSAVSDFARFLWFAFLLVSGYVLGITISVHTNLYLNTDWTDFGWKIYIIAAAISLGLGLTLRMRDDGKNAESRRERLAAAPWQ